jgi:serine/threonine-protein kinase
LWGFFPQEFAAPRGLLAVVVPLAGIIMLVPGIYAPIYRYRHVSTPSQRQQTKWFVLGLSLFIILPMTQVALSGSLPFFQQPGPATEMFTTFSTLTSVCIPLSIMVAILRYRLWDVDFVINRSLVYGGLTLLLGGAFTGGFFALRFVFEALFGSEQAVLSAAAATFVVVALFNPVRKWVRAFVDRRLYGIGIDYAQAARAKRAVPRVDTGDTRTSLGNYTGLELLGRGGMGEVYRAEHPTLKRPVAIKVLPTHLTGDPQATQRFVREAQTISRLSHRNIVALYDFGEHQGAPYMVMEYVNGRSLASLLKARGRLSLRDALPLLHDIAAALDYAHGQGIVHRDIKPANVMVEEQAESRRAILMDFGIAKLYEVTMQLTGTGGFVGTLDYIAPEQIQGAKEVDGRADVYSFGVMAYEALTGEKPFKHSNPGAMIMAHLMEPPPSPAKLVPELSDEIGEAVRQAMAKKPEERFITAGEFVGALG